MTHRPRAYSAAREAKRQLPAVEQFREPEDGPDDDEGPIYSCPGCYKARPEPFHCTACNADAEGPGYDD